MKTLNECAIVLRNLCAPLAAHSCETVQVYCKEQNFEYQMHEISRERSHLIGYQCALKDLDTYGNRDYTRTVEAIDCAGSGVVAAHGLGHVACLERDGTGEVDEPNDDCPNCGGSGGCPPDLACRSCGGSGENKERTRQRRDDWREDTCRDDD